MNDTGYYMVALPYLDKGDYGHGFVVDGWVASAHNLSQSGNYWVADVSFNEHRSYTFRCMWESRKSFATKELALRCAARAMLVLIAKEDVGKIIK